MSNCFSGYLNLKEPSKNEADYIFFYFNFYFYLSKKVRLRVSGESSDKQDSHEIPRHIFSEYSRLSSAAVLIGGLRVDIRV